MPISDAGQNSVVAGTGTGTGTGTANSTTDASSSILAPPGSIVALEQLARSGSPAPIVAAPSRSGTPGFGGSSSVGIPRTGSVPPQRTGSAASSSSASAAGFPRRTTTDEDGLVTLEPAPASASTRKPDPSETIDKMILQFKLPGLFGGTSFNSALPIFAYSAASIMMTLTNKGVLSGFGFTMNFLLLAVQCIAVVLFLELFRYFQLVEHRPFRKTEAKTWFPVSVLLALMIYTGSKAVQYLSISLFTVFKNMTIIAIAYAERFFLNGAPVSNDVLFAFGLMILSSIIAGWDDIMGESGGFKKDAFGVGKGVAYFWMFANCVTSAAYAVGMRGAMKHVKFKEFDVVFYNNLLSTPILLIASFIFESSQWRSGRYSVLDPDDISASALMGAIAVSSVSSFAISYSSSWCVRATSSTTFSMTGALNKLPIAIAGMVVFGDPVTIGSVMGVSIAFLAGIVYTRAKNAQSATAAKEHQPVLPMTTVSKSQADAELDKLLDSSERDPLGLDNRERDPPR